MSINKLNSEGYYDPTASDALANIANARRYPKVAVDKGAIPGRSEAHMNSRYSCSAKAHLEFILVNVPYDRADMMKVIRAIWNPRLKAYTLPLTIESVKALLSVSGMQLDERLTYMAESTIIEPSAGEQMPSTAAMQMPVKVDPFIHQVQAFNLGLQKPSVALLMEMGTGKTVTAIGIAGARYLRGEVKRVLVICPVSVISVWLKELKEMADFPVNVIAPEGDSVKKGMAIKAHRFSAKAGCKS